MNYGEWQKKREYNTTNNFKRVSFTKEIKKKDDSRENLKSDETLTHCNIKL